MEQGWYESVLQSHAHKKSERYTLVLAVSQKKVVAWQLVDNSANKEKLCHFLDQRLIPAMQTEGLHEVLLDNASIHRAKDVKKLWEEDSQMRPFILTLPTTPTRIRLKWCLASSSVNSGNFDRRVRRMEQAIADVIQSQVTEEKLTPIFRHALRS